MTNNKFSREKKIWEKIPCGKTGDESQSLTGGHRLWKRVPTKCLKILARLTSFNEPRNIA